jgi:DNA repair exonuclease SbcCD ATPase subunit
MAKYNFPQILNVKIRNFSLYKKEDIIVNIDEKVTPGIFCLAGANGLGKSTFLTILNYALTGLVLDPDKGFFSPSEITKENKDFTVGYFDGRIKASEKRKAEVELLFTVNDRYYRIVRGFFEIDSLRELEIYKLTKNKKMFLPIEKYISAEYLYKKYQEEIIKDIGITKYEYFIFLQLYVLTFDENRRLLFWDYRALSNALSISFSNNLDEVEKYINTARKIEKHESDARNHRWQAKQISVEIEKLAANRKKPTNKDKKNYLEICNKYDNIQKNYDNLSNEYNNLINNRNCLHSDILALEIKYKEYFSNYSEPKSKLLNSTFVQMMVNNEECLVCGAKGKYIIEKMNKNIHKNSCPLCNTSISNENSKSKITLLEKIKEIDKQIAEKRKKLDIIIKEVLEKELIIKKTDIELKKLYQQKNKIEHDCPEFLDNDNDHDAYISKLKEQYLAFDKKSKESYKKRDELMLAFNLLEKKMKKAYSEGEAVFVPVYKELAKSFIGYDLEIKLVTKNRRITLILDLDSSARTESYKLSESQRFFLDIALRMSLAIYLSSSKKEATLLIDTPEGALDIAYENRVGKMFAHFINSYSQNMLMTANINSSELLVSLANNIKNDKMVMRRMLDWIDLSIVQKEEEKLFKKYFNNVESLLRKKR